MAAPRRLLCGDGALRCDAQLLHTLLSGRWAPISCVSERAQVAQALVVCGLRCLLQPDSLYLCGVLTRRCLPCFDSVDQAMPALFCSIFLQVKSDEHMAKVKEQLLFEKQQIEAAEQR